MRRLMSLCLFLIFLAFPLSASAQSDDDALRVVWMRPTLEADDATVALVAQQIADFEAANPTIDVTLDIMDWATGPDTIRQQIIDGNPPDIAMLGGRHVPSFVADGFIQPLDPFITREFRARFVPAIINEGAIYQGRTFGLPVAASTRALFYNQDLFDQAGLDGPPENWDDLLAAGQALQTETDVAGFGLQGGGGLETNTYFYYFLWGNGGDLYNTSQTESVIDSPEAIEALAYVQTLVTDNATQPAPYDETYARRRALEDAFQQGNLGMVISGPWFINRLRTEAPDLNFGIAPLPYNTTPATYGVADALVMLSTTRQPENAWRLLEFLYEDDRRQAYVLQEGILPVLTNVAEAPDINDDPDFSVFLSLLPAARFEPLHIQSEQISQIVIEAIRAVYRGERTPDEALTDAASRINELLLNTVAGW